MTQDGLITNAAHNSRLSVFSRAGSGHGLWRRGVWRLVLAALLAGGALSRAAEPVTIVDLLVLYTVEARVEAGAPAALEAQVALAIAEANDVFESSRAHLRIRVAHSAEVAYAESGNLTTDLDRLRLNNDGFLDGAEALRSRHQADLVCLITASGEPGFHGLAGPSEEKAFCAIRRWRLTGGCFLPIAMGFNFGCQLARAQADRIGAFAFSHGYSVSTPHGRFSSLEAFEGTRLLHFSNPDLFAPGGSRIPMGVPAGLPGAADNARTLNLTAPVVAAFRGSAQTTLPPKVSIVGAIGTATNPLPVLAWADLALRAVAEDPDGTVEQLQFYLDYPDRFARLLLGTAERGSGTFVWSNVPPGVYSVFAQAVDNLGASSRSVENLVLRVAAVAPPNDDFGRRFSLEGTDVRIVGTNDGASIEPGESSWLGNSVWYSWSAAEDGRVFLTIPETSFDSAFSVFRGETVSQLTAVTYNWMDGFPESTIDFEVRRGEAYHVSVQGIYGRPSVFTLALRFHTRPSVRLVRPGPGARFHLGSLIDIEVEAAAGPDAPLERVEIFSESLRLATLTEAPFVTQWRADGLGNHSLGALAIDQAGQWRMSDFVSITVAPLNDDFDARAAVSGRDWVVSGNIEGSSLESGEPAHGGAPLWNSLWWTWTAPVSGRARAATASVFFWQAMGVYTGAALPDLTVVGSDHATHGYPAVVEFEAQKGVTYHFAVGAGAAGPDRGDFSLKLDLAAPPLNDEFVEAHTVTGASFTVTGANHLASKEVGEPSHAGQAGGRSVWWRWRAPFSGNAELSADSTEFNPVVAAYLGEAVSSLTPLIGGSNRPVQFRAVAGVEYRIAVDGAQGGVGSFTWRVHLAPSPPNDDFTNAIPVTGLSTNLQGSNASASIEPGEPAHGDLPGGRSVWWSWRAPANGWLEIDPRATTAFERMVAVYQGDVVTNLTRVAASSTSFFTAFGFNVRAGEVYHLAVAGVDRGAGPLAGEIELRLNESPVPPNDNFDRRTLVTGTNVVVHVTNVAATREMGEPTHGLSGRRSTWWTWTAPASGRATVWAFSWTVDTLVGVYQGTSLTTLARVGTRGYSAPGAFNAYIKLDAIAGATYQIAVDSRDDQGGPVALVLNFSPGLANDSFFTPQPLAGTHFEVEASNLGATSQPAEPAQGGYPPNRSVWYGWTSPGAGMLQVTVGNSLFSPRWSASTGEALESLTPIASASSWPTLDPAVGSFAVKPGQIYRISVDAMLSSWLEEGFFTLGLRFVPHPVNDDFKDATELQGTMTIATGDTTAAAREPDEPVHGWGLGLGTIWWRWTAPGNGTGILDASESAVPLALTVFAGSSLTNLTRLTPSATRVLFAAEAGITYYVVAEQTWPGPGGSASFSLLLSQLRLVGATHHSVIRQPAELVLQAEVEPVDGHFPQIEFFANGSPLGAVTNAAIPFVWTNVPPGTQSLTLRAANEAGWVHETIPVEVVVRPGNDDFDSRQFLDGGTNVIVHGSALAATFEPDEPDMTLPSVWYAWTAPFSGRAHVYVAGRPGLYLQVFRGPALDQLVELGSGPVAEAWFDVRAGQSYEFAVQSAASSPDLFLFHLRAYALPENDSFADRVLLPSRPELEIYGTAFVSTVETDEPPTPFGSVWYAWTAPSTGRARVSVSGWFEPKLRAFFGTALGELQEIQSTSESERSFHAVAGQSYAIAVLANPVLADQFLLSLHLDPGALHDEFASRIALPSATQVSVYGTGFASSAEPALFPTNANTGSVWYAWTAPLAGKVNASVAGWFGPSMKVFRGTNLAELMDVGAGPGTELSFDVEAGETCVIAVLAPAELPDQFLLQLMLSPSPAHDRFTQRARLEGTRASATGSLLMARAEAGEPDHGGRKAARSVWWTWTALESGSVTLSAAPTDFAPTLAVYTGETLTSLVTLASGTTDSLTFAVSKGAGYQIVLDSSDEAPGNYTLTLSLTVAVRSYHNDDFADRFLLSEEIFAVAANNELATTEANESLPRGASGRSLWWSWTADARGRASVRISSAAPSSPAFEPLPPWPNRPPLPLGRDHGPLVSVWQGDSLSRLTLVASNSFFSSFPVGWRVLDEFSVPLADVGPYQICIDGCNGSSGAFSVEWRFSPAPRNDSFDDRVLLESSGPIIETGTTAAATRERGEPSAVPSPVGGTVWYAWRATMSGTVQLNVDPGFFLGVHVGTHVSDLLTVVAGSAAASFYAVAGVEYAIAVDDGGNLGRSFNLTMFCPPPPPRIASFSVQRFADGSVGLRVVGTNAQSFVVQASTNLVNWETVRVGAMQGASQEFVDLDAKTWPRRFYRVQPLESLLINQLRVDSGSFNPDGTFSVRVIGSGGEPVSLQASTNLVDWTEVTRQVLIGNRWDWQDPDARDRGKRFYRARPFR